SQVIGIDAPLGSEGERDLRDGPDARLLDWAIYELAKLNLSASQDLRDKVLETIESALLRAATSVHANSKELPHDFNVCGYLLRNVDVLFSCSDPYKHYLEHGKAENRAWDLGTKIVIRTPEPISRKDLGG